MTRYAITSTVVGRAQILAGAGSAALVATVMAAGGAAPWLIAPAVLAVAATTAHLAVVRLGAGGGRVVIGQGIWPLPARTIDTASLVEASAVDLSWPQAFGLGVRWHSRTTRLTVRAGPTLRLRTRDGEHLSISTSDPAAVLRLLELPTPEKEAS